MNYKKLSYPYIIWCSIFIILPLIMMIVLAITKTNGFDFSNAFFTSQNFFKVLEPVYVTALYNSLKYGIIASLLCLILGYPLAFFMAFSKSKYKRMYVILLLIPTWNNMLLRILAWEKLFQPNSLVNIFGISLDLIGTPTAVLIGMVSIYLPFTVLPIYTVLRKIDKSVIEASQDLRSTKMQTIRRVILPLSKSGIVTGIIMTFLPAATAFAIPERLSGGKILLIGNIIENQFMTTFNYNFGSMISLIVIIIILGSMIAVLKLDPEGETL